MVYSNMVAEQALDTRVHTVRSGAYPGNPHKIVLGQLSLTSRLVILDYALPCMSTRATTRVNLFLTYSQNCCPLYVQCLKL